MKKEQKKASEQDPAVLAAQQRAAQNKEVMDKALIDLAKAEAAYDEAAYRQEQADRWADEDADWIRRYPPGGLGGYYRY